MYRETLAATGGAREVEALEYGIAQVQLKVEDLEKLHTHNSITSMPAIVGF